MTTHSFDNILFVPLTGGAEPPAVFEDAVTLAETHRARLTIFDVIPDVSAVESEIRFDEHRSITDLAVSALTAQFLDWARRYEDRVPISVDVAVGRRPVEVTARVRSGHHDLVIVAPDESRRTHSTLRRLLRVCRSAVLVLRGPVTTGDVMAAVDPSDRFELNASIVDVARSHAERHDRDLEVLYAWQPYAADLLVRGEHATVGADEFAAWAARVEAVHHESLGELLARLGIERSSRVHLVEDTPVEAIAGASDRLGVGLVVVGSAGRRRMESLLAGKTAERLIAAHSVSVLVVRPPDFERA